MRTQILLVTAAIATQAAQAGTIIVRGGTTTIDAANSFPTDELEFRLGFPPAFEDPTVNFLAGGNALGVSIYNRGMLNMSGGTVTGDLNGRHRSTLAISNAQIGNLSTGRGVRYSIENSTIGSAQLNTIGRPSRTATISGTQFTGNVSITDGRVRFADTNIAGNLSAAGTLPVRLASIEMDFGASPSQPGTSVDGDVTLSNFVRLQASGDATQSFGGDLVLQDRSVAFLNDFTLAGTLIAEDDSVAIIRGAEGVLNINALDTSRIRFRNFRDLNGNFLQGDLSETTGSITGTLGNASGLLTINFDRAAGAEINFFVPAPGSAFIVAAGFAFAARRRRP